MLTNATVKAARARSRPYKIFDERGLHLHVAPSGRLTWRVKYRWQGQEQLLTIGCYPDVGLTDARVQCDAAHESLARGEKPVRQSSATSSVTFEDAARAWIALKRPGWTSIHAGDVLDSLERDALPAIGAMPIRAIRAPNVLQLLRAVELRGAGETTRRLRQRISAIFKLAVSEGWANANPAADAGEALRPPSGRRRMPALTDVDDARALLGAAELVDVAPATKLASRFLALTAVRLACVRGARWDEIEDLDGAAPMWRVPASRMKLAAPKKLDSANDHLVPLSAAAVAVLRAARALCIMHEVDAPSAGLIFHGRAGRAIAEGAIGALYAAAGYRGRHVPHGWRASFSTIMNERFPLERDAIDRTLGHVLKGEDGKTAKVEAAYNRSEQLARRRALLDAWADLLVP